MPAFPLARRGVPTLRLRHLASRQLRQNSRPHFQVLGPPPRPALPFIRAAAPPARGSSFLILPPPPSPGRDPCRILEPNAARLSSFAAGHAGSPSRSQPWPGALLGGLPHACSSAWRPVPARFSGLRPAFGLFAPQFISSSPLWPHCAQDPAYSPWPFCGCRASVSQAAACACIVPWAGFSGGYASHALATEAPTPRLTGLFLQ